MYRKSSIKPPGGLIFFQALLRGGLIEMGGLKEKGGSFKEQGLSRTDLWFPGSIPALSNYKKMVTFSTEN